MPILEAMAAGVPVVTANRSALPEVAGDAALMVDAARGDDLADALKLLAADEGKRTELIRRGLERTKVFSWQKALSGDVAGLWGTDRLDFSSLNFSSLNFFFANCYAKGFQESFVLSAETHFLLGLAGCSCRLAGIIASAILTLIKADGRFQNQEDVVSGSFDLSDSFGNALRVGQRFVDRIAQILHQFFKMIFQYLPPLTWAISTW